MMVSKIVRWTIAVLLPADSAEQPGGSPAPVDFRSDQFDARRQAFALRALGKALVGRQELLCLGAQSEVQCVGEVQPRFIAGERADKRLAFQRPEVGQAEQQPQRVRHLAGVQSADSRTQTSSSITVTGAV